MNVTNDPGLTASTKLSRVDTSAAITSLGWRYLRAELCTSVRTCSLVQAADLAAQAVVAAGDDAGEHLRADVRCDGVVLTLQSLTSRSVTSRDIELARRISALVRGLGLVTCPAADRARRSVKLLEIAIDALDIDAIRPFWKAVLGYDDEPGTAGPADAVCDPLGQGPAVWFQQMATPRSRSGRIHFDITVPHDEAACRIDAALAAGGVLISDAQAPAFWLLADAEGNKVCVCTWQCCGS